MFSSAKKTTISQGQDERPRVKKLLSAEKTREKRDPTTRGVRKRQNGATHPSRQTGLLAPPVQALRFPRQVLKKQKKKKHTSSSE